MKKLLKTTLSLLLFFIGCQHAQAGHSTTPLSDYAGTWANVEEGGITKLIITVEGSQAYVQAFGSCHPKDCDWGRVEGASYSSGISTSPQKNTQAITAVFRSGPGEEVHIVNTLVIHLGDAGQLQVRKLTDYTDDSGRYSQTSTCSFKKAS